MKTRKTSLVQVMLFATLLTSSQIFAQEGGVTETPVQLRKSTDAAVDRNIVLPSAETLSAGDLTFNDYELVLAGFSYGITNDMQASLTTLLPIVKSMPFVLVSAFKWRLVATDQLVFSIQPSAGFGTKSGDTLGQVGLGFLLDFVLDSQGKFVLSFSETNYWGFGSIGDEDLQSADGIAFLLSAGFNARVHKNVKLLTEFIMAGGVYDGEFNLVDEAVLFNYGVRFCSPSISVDLTFLRPISSDVPDELVMGIPYVTFSARF